MKRQYIIKSALILILSLFLAVSCSKENEEKANNNQSQNPVTAKVYPIVSADKHSGNLASDFAWMQDGKQVKFSDYTKDKYVFLNFWGTWCPPCRGEIPDIIQIAKEMESKGLVVIGIALERTNSMEDAKATVTDFWTNKKMGYPVIVGSMEITEAYGGISSVPTTFLINKKGEIVQTISGAKTKEEFMAEIKDLMKN
jgi:cytochrome c-type biogenesis protein